MSHELCEMSLQQTRELLRLTDSILRDICCRHFGNEELYVLAVRTVLGCSGRRGPRSIFISLAEPESGIQQGRVFHRHDGTMVEMSELFQLEPDSVYTAQTATEVTVISNWNDACTTIAEYQRNFHPRVNAFMTAPILNFIFNRITGERPGAMIAFNYPGEATEYDANVLRSLSVVVGSLVSLSNEVRQTERAFIYTIEALARACEAAEEDTGHHIQRVNRYAGALAANMGLDPAFVEVISYSAQMHDVGKIKIPQTILLKKEPLTADELALVRMHPTYGELILGDSPRLEVARQVAISHHENWDGSGYPHGLKGDSIPLAGRIVKLADVYDALRSRRSYKSPLSHEETLRVMANGDDRIVPRHHFAPDVLATFFRIEAMFEKIYRSLCGEAGVC